jgi:hypothetical protein
VAFDSYPSTPFLIDVVVIDVVSNLDIILHKGLIENLDGSFHRQQSKATIPHLEGGFFTIYNEPLIGSSVETFDEPSDQLLCINSDLNNWFVQEGSYMWIPLKKLKEYGPWSSMDPTQTLDWALE